MNLTLGKAEFCGLAWKSALSFFVTRSATPSFFLPARQRRHGEHLCLLSR
jgi:hypothetical protein